MCSESKLKNMIVTFELLICSDQLCFSLQANILLGHDMMAPCQTKVVRDNGDVYPHP